MKTQRFVVKPILAVAMMFLIAVSVAPAMASDAGSGDISTVSEYSPLGGAGGHCPLPGPTPFPIVGQCTIDEHGVKHCPYPPFVISPEAA
jgi:hypothetical protein